MRSLDVVPKLFPSEQPPEKADAYFGVWPHGIPPKLSVIDSVGGFHDGVVIGSCVSNGSALIDIVRSSNRLQFP